MLAYAANRPAAVDRRPHPNAMLAIIAVHVALLAAVMSAKMDFDRHPPASPILIDSIPAAAAATANHHRTPSDKPAADANSISTQSDRPSAPAAQPDLPDRIHR